MDINSFSIPPKQYEIQHWLLGRGQVVEARSDHRRSGRSRSIAKRRRHRKERQQAWHSLDLGQFWKRRNSRLLEQGNQRDGQIHHHRRRHTWTSQTLSEDGSAVVEEKGEGKEREISKAMGEGIASLSYRRRQKQMHMSLLLDVPLQMAKLELRRGSNGSIEPGPADLLTGNSSLLLNSPLLTSASSRFPSATTTAPSNRSSTFSAASTATSATICSTTSTLPSSFLPSTTCPTTRSFSTRTRRPSTAPPSLSRSLTRYSTLTTMAEPPPDASQGLRASRPQISRASSQQFLRDGRDSLGLQQGSSNLCRPYGSPGRNGRFEQDEYLTGARPKLSHSTSQSVQSTALITSSWNHQVLPDLLAHIGQSNSYSQLARDSNSNNPEDKEEEPDATWLGAVDYHDFLTVNANREAALTPPQRANPGTTIRDCSVDLPRDKSASESRSLGRKSKFPSKTLPYEPSRSLRERKAQPLKDQPASEASRPATQDSAQTVSAKRSFFLRDPTSDSVSDTFFATPGKKLEAFSSKLSKADLSKFVTPRKGRNIPASLTTPSNSSRSTAKTPVIDPSPTVAGRLNQRTAPPTQPSALGPSGSLASIPWKRSRPEKVGLTKDGLPPRTPSSTKLPPVPPLPSKKEGLPAKCSRPIMSDTATDGDLQKSHSGSVPRAAEPLPEADQVSVDDPSMSSISLASTTKDPKDDSLKQKGPSLRTKVSKLFGDDNCDERTPRMSGTRPPSKSISAYRPISLISHDPNGASFSDIFDEVYNATQDSFQSVGNSRPSADVTGPSERPSTSLASRKASVALSTVGNDNLSLQAVSVGSTGNSRISTATSTEPDVPIPTESSHRSSAILSREDLAEQLAARLGLSDPSARAEILSAFTKVAPPTLHDHPAIRGDLALQVGVGLLKNQNTEPTSSALISAPTKPVTPSPAATVQVPAPLNVNRLRSAQQPVAGAKNKISQSSATAELVTSGFTTRYLVKAYDMAKNLVTPTPEDPFPAFDRTVDLTWYRYTELLPGHRRRVHQPKLARIFGHVQSMYVAKYGRGKENWAKYDQPMYKGRFRYFDLPASIRFQIMQNVLEGHLPNQFILLNGKRQAAPAWPPKEFASLWDVMGKIQNYLTVCPRFRADVMVTFLMTQPFHVIFSPFVKPGTQPLPTKWLFNYAQYMQNVRVEVDLTKLGFGATWDSTSISTKLREIGNLVWVFAEEMEKRDPVTNPMTLLTIYCRRYFGYRQGRNPFEGNLDMYRLPLIGGEEEGHGPKVNKGLPRYYGRPSTSLPPSHSHPYSKQRLHHNSGSDKVPYLHEGHMSVFHPFRRLQGRVWMVRMVGLSEKWVRDHHTAWWPTEDLNRISNEDKLNHIDRCIPTDFTYVAHNHAIYVDGGINKGIQRIPALPEKKQHTCIYDKENDVFLENGTCNVLTVVENGVEVIPRADTKSMRRSELAATGEPDDPLELPDEDTMSPPPVPSKNSAAAIPRENNSNNRNNTANASRKVSNNKAAKVLGVTLPENGLVSSQDTSAVSSSEPSENGNGKPPPAPPKVLSVSIPKNVPADSSAPSSASPKAAKILGVSPALPTPASVIDSAAASVSAVYTSPEDSAVEDEGDYEKFSMMVKPLALTVQSSRAASITSLPQPPMPPPPRASSAQSRNSDNQRRRPSTLIKRQRKKSYNEETGSEFGGSESRTSSVQGRRSTVVGNGGGNNKGRQMSYVEGSDLSEQNSRASSVQSSRRPRALSTKKSLMSLLSREKKGKK